MSPCPLGCPLRAQEVPTNQVRDSLTIWILDAKAPGSPPTPGKLQGKNAFAPDRAEGEQGAEGKREGAPGPPGQSNSCTIQ